MKNLFCSCFLLLNETDRLKYGIFTVNNVKKNRPSSLSMSNVLMWNEKKNKDRQLSFLLVYVLTIVSFLDMRNK
jgi:hypothetical protein